MGEKLPIGTVHNAVLEFLVGRDDVAVTGAMGVNAYVQELRHTSDVDLLTTHQLQFSQALADYLSRVHSITVDVKHSTGRHLQLHEVRAPASRHLVDVRGVDVLPPVVKRDGYQVLAPAQLVAHKIVCRAIRRNSPSFFLHWRDIAVLLLRFPELKRLDGEVSGCLARMDASPQALSDWRELVESEILPDDEDAKFAG